MFITMISNHLNSITWVVLTLYNSSSIGSKKLLKYWLTILAMLVSANKLFMLDFSKVMVFGQKHWPVVLV